VRKSSLPPIRPPAQPPTRAASRAGSASPASNASPDEAGTTKLPSRDDLIAYIAREREAAGEKAPTKIGKREIARAFDIKGDDRIALKRLLRELEAEGAIERRRKVLTSPGRLPPVVVAEIYSRDRDGDLLAKPGEWDEALGPAPKIAITLPRKPRSGAPVPGLGDRALIRVEPLPAPQPNEPAYTGRLIKLLPRGRAGVLGLFRADPNGRGGRIVPLDKKHLGKGELQIAEADRGAAQDGDLVSVEILRTGRLGLPSARVQEKIGAYSSEKAVSLIAIHAHGLPHVFGAEVLTEAERAQPMGLGGREDWRALQLVTIDPPDARDHDDAVHAAPDPDPANPGGHILTVAIADVAAYVRPGGALDREAQERGNSVYFPDRVVPMLPERISNDLCSLRPNEDRPALAVRMLIAADGHKLSHSFHRVLMRSAAKLSYAQAQAALDGTADETTEPLLEQVLKPLQKAHDSLQDARRKRGPLDLDLPERKIKLDTEGKIERIFTPARLETHRLIEEFMILANVCAAETLEAHHQPLIYRTHDEPTLEKLNALAEFLHTIDIKLAKGQVLRPAQFNGILARVRETEHEHLVNEIVLRTQAQAEYVTQNYGHFGLNLRRYAHFTSPIRRYADLIVHRALITALKLGEGGLPRSDPAELAEIAAKISSAERRAMAAERETVERLIAIHLADQVGAQFEGRISGVNKAGLFIRLAESGADGFVPISSLAQDYFRYEEGRHALIGSRTGLMHRLGDLVSVRLVEAAPLAGALRFELLEGGRPSRAPSRAKIRGETKRGSEDEGRVKTNSRVSRRRR